MKPIEPGCLAMAICPEYYGRTVRVGRFLGAVEGLDGHDWWECFADWRPKGSSEIGQERVLMRIDGYTETQEAEEAACA